MRTCSSCNESKPLSDFYPTKTGVRSSCKTCCAEYRRRYRRSEKGKLQTKKDKAEYLQRNRQKVRDYQREYHKSHPYYEANREDILARLAKKRKTDPAYQLRTSEQVKKWVQSRKQYINSLKEGKPCTDCGLYFPVWCLDFDHVRGNKVNSVSQMTYASLADITEEVSKCELVCANCHRVRTDQRRNVKEAATRHTRRIRANQTLVDSLKHAPCTDCGGTFTPIAMDYDHIRFPKIATVSQLIMRGASWERVQAEIDKCELVCSNCHRTRTRERRMNSGKG